MSENNQRTFPAISNIRGKGAPFTGSGSSSSMSKALMPIIDTSGITRQLITEKELATILGVSPYWCQKSRWRGDGPPYVRVGAAIRYHIPSVEAWLQSRIMTSTSQTMEDES